MRNTTFRLVDLTGLQFDRLTVLAPAEPAADGALRWRCRCSCGGPNAECVVRAVNLRAGGGSRRPGTRGTRSCGCLIREVAIARRRECPPPNFVSLVGQRFGRLVVVARAESRQGRTRWHCRCDCGGEHTATATNLRSGGTRSCGCLVREAGIENGRKRRERSAAMGTRTNNAPHDAAEGAGA